MEKKRDKSIDIIKAVGIIMVCVQHAITNQRDVDTVALPVLLSFVTQIDMPLFFCVNGYFFSKKYSEKPIKGILKKIKSYYLPFVEYNLVYLALHNIFYYLHLVDENNGNGFYTLKDTMVHVVSVITGHREYFAGAMWFLRSLLIVSVIYILADWAISYIFKGKFRMGILAAITLGMVILSITGIVPAAHRMGVTVFYSLYFFVGMCWREFRLDTLLKKYKYYIFVVGIGINIVAAVFNPYGVAKYPQTFAIPLAILGTAGIAAFSHFRLFDKDKIICYIGKYTLQIMGMHFLCFKFINFIIVKVYNLPIERMADYPVVSGVDGAWWIAYSIVGLLLPIGVSVLFEESVKLLKRKWQCQTK